MSTAAFLIFLPAAAFSAALAGVVLSWKSTPLAGSSPAWRRAALVGLPAIAFLATIQLDLGLAIDTDDAPITFRYAENLASGRGFVYNEGDRVLGTSTPLFTLLLAVTRMASVGIETTALLLALAGMVASVIALLRIGRHLAGWPGALFAAALVLTEAPFLVYATQGMETIFYGALILWTFVFHLEKRDVAAALLASLCVLTRLDGLAVPAALAVSYLLSRKWPSRWALGAFALPLIPWFLFSWVYFGTVFPQSMTAKLMHTRHSQSFWMLRSLLVEGSMLFMPFGILGAARIFFQKARDRSIAMPAWLVLYVGAFTITAIDAYPWYRIPPLPVAGLLAASGLAWVATALFNSSSIMRRPAVLVVVIAALLPLFAQRYFFYHDSLAEYSRQLKVWERPRIATAEWLRDHAPTGTTVATSAIGHIGWISGLEVFDTSYLINPKPHSQAAMLEQVRPEFVVGLDGDPLSGEFRLEHPDYELARSLAQREVPEVVYHIYKRKDVQLIRRPPGSETE
jgi:hypothetical protein